MNHSLPTSAVVLVLLVATLVSPFGAVAPVEASAAENCENAVIYDEFRFDNSLVSAAANGSATASAQNTEVTVEQATGFIRIDASNPNGYCVEFHVRLSEEIVEPAELGDVDSNGGDATAEWHAVRDFERGETYTEVVFTLPAASQATFAPSKLRVKSLSWTGSAKTEGASIWERWSNWGDDEPLEQRTYRFSAENSTETITVSLHNESTNQSVEEWQAMYRTSEEAGWRPVTSDSGDPVFYRQIDDNRVQFVFNDPDAEVRFTANPSTWDKANHEWDSYWGGKNAVSEFLSGLFD